MKSRSHRCILIIVVFVNLIFIGQQSLAGSLIDLDCSMAAEQAAVRLFEYIEDPKTRFDSDSSYRSIFSKRLLSTSSNSSVSSVINAARSTYQDNRAETPLSRRLAAPPTLIPRQDDAFNAYILPTFT